MKLITWPGAEIAIMCCNVSSGATVALDTRTFANAATRRKCCGTLETASDEEYRCQCHSHATVPRLP